MQHGNPTSFVGPLVAHFENLDKIQYICIGIFIFVRVDNSQVNSCDGICGTRTRYLAPRQDMLPRLTRTELILIGSIEVQCAHMSTVSPSLEQGRGHQ